MELSYIEIYKDKINDLIGDAVINKTEFCSSYDSLVTKRNVESLNEINEVLNLLLTKILNNGRSKKQTAQTAVNDNSSRGHSILHIAVKAREKTNSTYCESVLNFVDLAGIYSF